jgi:DNA-binding transcriptional LysR family regulator
MDGARMDEIAAFLAVVKAKSFTGAGRILGRDASIISRRVNALETRLGIRLLERSTRKVAPTAAGFRLSERMRSALSTMREAEAEATHTGGTPTGVLRLAVPATFGRLRIAPMLPDFLKAYHSISFDVAIRLGELEDNQLVVKKLATHRRLICATPSYLETHGTPRTPHELTKHACLTFSLLAGHPEWRFRQRSRVSAVRVAGPLTADDAQSLVTAALAGLGIVMCSDWLAAHERSAGLVPILTDWSVEGEGNVHLIRPSARFTAAKTRSFVDWISEKLKQPPWISPDRHAS